MRLFLLILMLLPSVSEAYELPARAREILDSRTALPGPNCWNSALYGAGLVNGLRHVTGDEFTAWISSPLCREVPEAEAAGGDIVAFRRSTIEGKLVDGPYGSEIHAFLLVSPNEAFTKNGAVATYEFRLQDLVSLREQYEKANRSECRMLDFPRSHCALKAQYFRCESSAVSVPEALFSVTLATAALEARLHRLYTGVGGEAADPAKLENAKVEIRARVSVIEQELAKAVSGGGLEGSGHEWKAEVLRQRLRSAGAFTF